MTTQQVTDDDRLTAALALHEAIPGKWCPGCGDVAPCATWRVLTGAQTRSEGPRSAAEHGSAAGGRPHTPKTLTEGCWRCDLNRDEMGIDR